MKPQMKQLKSIAIVMAVLLAPLIASLSIYVLLAAFRPATKKAAQERTTFAIFYYSNEKGGKDE